VKTEVKDEWDRPSSAAPQGWAVTYEVSADRRRTRMHLPPLQVAVQASRSASTWICTPPPRGIATTACRDPGANAAGAEAELGAPKRSNKAGRRPGVDGGG